MTRRSTAKLELKETSTKNNPRGKVPSYCESRTLGSRLVSSVVILKWASGRETRVAWKISREVHRGSRKCRYGWSELLVPML